MSIFQEYGAFKNRRRLPHNCHQNTLQIWASARQNPQNGMCAQRKIRSASAKSDHSFRCPHEKKLWYLVTHLTQSEDWSDWADADWADAEADLCFRWAHLSFCWICLALALILLKIPRKCHKTQHSPGHRRTKNLNLFKSSGLFFLNCLDRFISYIRGVWLVFIITMIYRNSCTKCKLCRPWSDVAFCGVWSGSTLFANVPFMGR